MRSDCCTPGRSDAAATASGIATADNRLVTSRAKALVANNVTANAKRILLMSMGHTPAHSFVQGLGAMKVGIALLCIVALAACHRGEQVRFENAPAVLISIDTLRADHLPAYGYRSVETPHLDALRRD